MKMVNFVVAFTASRLVLPTTDAIAAAAIMAKAPGAPSRMTKVPSTTAAITATRQRRTSATRCPALPVSPTSAIARPPIAAVSPSAM